VRAQDPEIVGRGDQLSVASLQQFGRSAGGGFHLASRPPAFEANAAGGQQPK